MRGERGQHPEQGVGPSEDVGESGRIIFKGHNVFHLNFTNLVFMNKKWVVTYGFIIMRWFKSCPSSCFISGGIFYFCQNCNLTLDWISYKKYVTQLKFARIWHWFFYRKMGAQHPLIRPCVATLFLERRHLFSPSWFLAATKKSSILFYTLWYSRGSNADTHPQDVEPVHRAWAVVEVIVVFPCCRRLRLTPMVLTVCMTTCSVIES